ncbi:uncharacterized protein LOC143864232 [Tasmannia lanceolata]|uniref:uncharacterized protein LOC143864232 n=1 Tax=Tasmannia lanceolata TaxID=3420 RepID=UPI00406422E8
MAATTKMSTLPNYPKSTMLPCSKFLRSRFLVVGCLQKTACTCSLRLYPDLCFYHAVLPSLYSSRKVGWSVKSSVDSGSDPSESSSSTSGGTRLVRAIQAFQIKLNARLKEMKKGFPMKLLFFLVGFYCATAFATGIGQTGDWDILSAGLAVIVVEMIGALMYRASFPLVDKLRTLITMFNYWKAGLSLGLFLDAFKYEMDMILGLCNPFNFEIDLFTIFW